jgi:hypothetical protein
VTECECSHERERLGSARSLLLGLRLGRCFLDLRFCKLERPVSGSDATRSISENERATFLREPNSGSSSSSGIGISKPPSSSSMADSV